MNICWVLIFIWIALLTSCSGCGKNITRYEIKIEATQLDRIVERDVVDVSETFTVIPANIPFCNA